MQMIEKWDKPDYSLAYYIICGISFLTRKKVNKIETLKLKLKKKLVENSN